MADAMVSLPAPCVDHVNGNTTQVPLSMLMGRQALADLHFPASGRLPAKNLGLYWSDMLTLARAVYGEATGQSVEHRRSVMWTMVYRAQYMPHYRLNHRSLRQSVEAFSTVVNPRYALGGSRCPVATTQPPCTGQELRRRSEFTNLGWQDIPQDIRDMVIEFALGRAQQPARPRRAIGFAADYVEQGAGCDTSMG